MCTRCAQNSPSPGIVLLPIERSVWALRIVSQSVDGGRFAYRTLRIDFHNPLDIWLSAVRGAAGLVALAQFVPDFGVDRELKRAQARKALAEARMLERTLEELPTRRFEPVEVALGPFDHEDMKRVAAERRAFAAAEANETRRALVDSQLVGSSDYHVGERPQDLLSLSDDELLELMDRMAKLTAIERV